MAPTTRKNVRRRLAVVGVGVAGLAAAGITYAATSSDNVTTSSKGLPPVEVETGVVHVHGLGVDPGDGTLYAATHSGLFSIPDTGSAVRIANRQQDTMGFSIVGPGEFIGSGHPDYREDEVRPPLLGLIASKDAGQTWDRLSLHGKADFHALHAAHGLVYGYDSTSRTFMVSKDRENWDRRAAIEMADFAVSPSDADTVLATTAQGLGKSTDGGRTFAPVASAPLLVVLTWGPENRLYGVTPDGTVHVSEDGGSSWSKRGSVGGQPEAITLDVRNGQEVLYVAVSERGILSSTDGGRAFSTRYAP